MKLAVVIRRANLARVTEWAATSTVDVRLLVILRAVEAVRDARAADAMAALAFGVRCARRPVGQYAARAGAAMPALAVGVHCATPPIGAAGAQAAAVDIR